jgi:hypothetical protein
MNQELNRIIDNSLIEKSKSDYIKEKFESFTETALEWNKKANEILVTDETQTDLMALAKEGRLILKSKRIEIEKTRKSLKEQSLNEGRLIDGIAKHLMSIVEPAEKHLETQERFLEIQEQKRKAELKAERYKLMLPYAEVLDPETLQLDIITDEAFAGILNYAKTTLEAKIESDRIAKEEKEAKDKAEAQEMENIRLENIKLREDALSKQKEADDLKAKTDADLRAIAQEMKKQSATLKTIIKKEQVIVENVETLKEKLNSAKTTMQICLNYIIHDDMRRMIEQTLKEIN